MQVIETKQNTFEIKGLSLGKLQAIERALRMCYESGTLSAVGHDVWNAIKTALHTVN